METDKGLDSESGSPAQPGNASREWSGSFKELRFKADNLRRKVKEELVAHRRQDRLERKREQDNR